MPRPRRFPEWSANWPRRSGARLLLKAADILAVQGRRLRRRGGRRDRQPGALGALQCRARRRHDPRGGVDDDADHRRGRSRPNRPGSTAMAIRQPVGVVLSIAPWNAPIILGVRSIAMPLACGNTVVFKASENCPRTHALIVEAFREAGLPQGRHQPRHQRAGGCGEDRRGADRPSRRCGASTSPARPASAGSSPRPPARYLKPVLLELGGKAPLIVLDDADIDEAVNAAVFGAFANAGPDLHVDGEDRPRRTRSPTRSSSKFAAARRGLAGRRSARPCRPRRLHQHRRRAGGSPS